MNTEINGVKTLDTGCTTQISLVISPQPGFGLPIPLGFYRQLSYLTIHWHHMISTS